MQIVQVKKEEQWEAKASSSCLYENEGTCSLVQDKYFECVYGVSVHMAIVGGDTPVIQPPEEHVGALGDVRQIVHDTPPLLHVRFGVGLHCVNHIWELYQTRKRDNFSQGFSDFIFKA